MLLKVSGIITIESEVILKGGEYISNFPKLHTHFVVPMLPSLCEHGN